jgi:lipoprotein-anchoring transpeptidase ErfK/SrfK
MPAKNSRSLQSNHLPVVQQPTRLYPRPASRRRGRGLLWLLAPVMFLLVVAGGIIGGGLAHVYARGRILPGVTSMGVPLSGHTPSQAAASLQSAWDTRPVVVRFEEDTWTVRPGELGLVLDVAATAEIAARKGRSAGDPAALLDQRAAWFDVAPVWRFDPEAAQRTLTQLASLINVAPVDATIRIDGGRAEAIPATEGRELDPAATLAVIQADPVGVLNSGQLELIVRPVPATVTDVSPAVDEANRLLVTTVTLEAYDPITDETRTWPVEPPVWSRWLRLAIDPDDPQSFHWVPDDPMGAAFLDDLEVGLGDGRAFDRAATLNALIEGIQHQQPIVRTRLYHPERQHLVQSGETLSSIGYDYGIPYPWIQQANPGVNQLSVGQTITISSPDVMLPLEPVPGKRIVVSLGEQRTRVFENGELKWDWPSSTGIDSSPTAPGVFQVQSHEPNAYAGNWDLWMPSFLGIYRPVPSSDFMNGFHGFPTRGNSQLLWTGDLGRRVTYGCILLSSDNAQLLYDWAEEGVVVEVRP